MDLFKSKETGNIINKYRKILSEDKIQAIVEKVKMEAGMKKKIRIKKVHESDKQMKDIDGNVWKVLDISTDYNLFEKVDKNSKENKSLSEAIKDIEFALCESTKGETKVFPKQKSKNILGLSESFIKESFNTSKDVNGNEWTVLETSTDYNSLKESDSNKEENSKIFQFFGDKLDYVLCEKDETKVVFPKSKSSKILGEMSEEDKTYLESLLKGDVIEEGENKTEDGSDAINELKNELFETKSELIVEKITKGYSSEKKEKICNVLSEYKSKMKNLEEFEKFSNTIITLVENISKMSKKEALNEEKNNKNNKKSTLLYTNNFTESLKSINNNIKDGISKDEKTIESVQMDLINYLK